MGRKSLCVALATSAAAAGILLPATVATAGSNVETFPLSQVRRGQKGYGLTTMQGTVPERFEFEVIGVSKNFLPKMDIILVKSNDKKLEVTGFWRGMSGSPLFIDGKLACAFSYGFTFNKKPIGGCTPIEYMRKEGFKAPRRLADETIRRGGGQVSSAARGKRIASPRSAASRTEWLEVAPNGHVGPGLMRSATAGRKPWMMSSPLPRGPRRPAGSEEGGMVPHALPLALSGFTAPAFEQAKALMSGYPLDAMAGGGTGDGTAGPHEFALGSSIAVQLARGDLSMAATGTVSFIEGQGVLAFGHPMFQAGEIYAPVAASEVHTVIPSAQSGFVLAQPLRELGALVQDRQSTISADVGVKTRMIPVDIVIEAGEGARRDKGEFHVEILNNRFFTGALAAITTMNAISLYLPDRDHVTAIMHSKVMVKGYQPLQFTDYLYSSQGAMGVVDGARGLRVLVPLLMNPFAPVDVERVELKVDLRWDTNFGDIKTLRLPSRELEPGKRSYVDVELTRYDGKSVVDRVPFLVPESLAGSIVKLEVTAGDSAQLDAAPPESVDDLMKAFRKLLPGNVYAVTLYTADEGAAIDGKIIRDLPSSALDKLHTGASTPRVESYRAIARSTSRANRVINGKQSVLIKVRDRKN